MSNSFSVVMTNILAGALDTLREECAILAVAPKDFRGAAAQKGSTVSVSVPVAQTAAAITPAATPPALADITPTEVQLTLDQWQGSRFHVTEKEFHEMANGNQVIPGQIAESVRAIANAVNTNVLSKYTGVYGFAGTPGTVPFATTLDALVDVRQVLNTQLCPDGNRFGLIDYSAEANYLKLAVNQNAYQAGNNDSLVKGALGERMGIKLFRESQIPLHTSTALTAGACTVNGAHAAGVKTVSIAKATNTSPLVVGDILMFNGDTQTYVVTAAVTLAVGNTNVAIEPGLKSAKSGGEAVTLKGTHRVNLMFDPAAWAIATRPLMGPIEGAPTIAVSQSMTDAKTGLSLRLDYIPGYHAAQWEMSLLWGAKVIDARRIARLAGAAS